MWDALVVNGCRNPRRWPRPRQGGLSACVAIGACQADLVHGGTVAVVTQQGSGDACPGSADWRLRWETSRQPHTGHGQQLPVSISSGLTVRRGRACRSYAGTHQHPSIFFWLPESPCSPPGRGSRRHQRRGSCCSHHKPHPRSIGFHQNASPERDVSGASSTPSGSSGRAGHVQGNRTHHRRRSCKTEMPVQQGLLSAGALWVDAVERPADISIHSRTRPRSAVNCLQRIGILMHRSVLHVSPRAARPGMSGVAAQTLPTPFVFEWGGGRQHG